MPSLWCCAITANVFPHMKTPVPGIFLASMAQVYPQDRGTNYAVRDGRATAKLVDAFLSNSRRGAATQTAETQ